MAKSKREEKDEEKGDYEFKLPDFDEKAFIRREKEGARASFITVGIGFAAGVVSTLLLLTSLDWKVGWLPILAAMAGMRPLLQRMGFSEEAVSWKALAGSFFMLFFTALSVWIVGANLV